jgi:hypothetical protein
MNRKVTVSLYQIIGSLAGLCILFIVILTVVSKRPVKAAVPTVSLCFVTSSMEKMDDYSPAEWIERRGLDGLAAKLVLSRCRGEFAGKQVEFDIVSPWPKRVGVNGKHME